MTTINFQSIHDDDIDENDILISDELSSVIDPSVSFCYVAIVKKEDERFEGNLYAIVPSLYSFTASPLYALGMDSGTYDALKGAGNTDQEIAILLVEAGAEPDQGCGSFYHITQYFGDSMNELLQELEAGAASIYRASKPAEKRTSPTPSM